MVGIEVTAIDLTRNTAARKADPSRSARQLMGSGLKKAPATKNVHNCGHLQSLLLQVLTKARVTFMPAVSTFVITFSDCIACRIQLHPGEFPFINRYEELSG